MGELEPRLFGYIWRYSRREQLAICGVVLASLPFYFASLDLPKRIVNDAITGKAFEQGNATAPFLSLTIHWPGFLGGGQTPLFAGFEVERVTLLFGLSGLFLALVLVNGAFKFWINLSKGVLGERMLRRLRFQLFSLMLRFNPRAQRQVKSSETATIIRDEVEPIGSFIGDAIVVPVFLGTQAATALGFILMQNAWLGLVAGTMVGVQIVVIPRLRREIIRLSRERQIASRSFAGRVAEVLDGLPAVTANDTARWERAEIGGRLHGLFDLRLRIYKRKFMVKYLNNLLAQVTPFLFYAIGGMFALKGQLDIGQLVAVLTAYRDLPPPLKELIDWDQQRLDVEVKYETVAAHFAANRLTPDEADKADSPSLGTPLRLDGVSLRNAEGGIGPIWPNASIPLPARIALLGSVRGEAGALAAALGGLQPLEAGSIEIGGHALASLSRTTRAARIAYAGPQPILFPGSIRDNVLYGLRLCPVMRAEKRRGAADIQRRREAQRSGNPVETVGDDWIDFSAFGASDAAALDAKVFALLSRLGMGEDIYRFGLDALSLQRHDTPNGQKMIAARMHLRELFSASGMSGLVIPFAKDVYNDQATVAENLLFGVPRDEVYAGRRLAGEPRFRAALTELGLLEPLSAMGVEIAHNLLDIVQDIPMGHPLFRQFSMIEAEEVPKLAHRMAGIDAGTRRHDDDEVMLRLTLPYIEPRQRFGLLSPALKKRIVEARPTVQAALRGPNGCGVEPYEADRINPSMSVLDNLLFGRIDTARAHGDATIRREIRAVVREFRMGEAICRRGLQRQVGNRGQDMNPRQQATIDLARAILRRPEILVVDGAVGKLEGGARTLISAFAAEAEHWTGHASLVAVVEAAEEAEAFDTVLSPQGVRGKLAAGRQPEI